MDWFRGKVYRMFKPERDPRDVRREVRTKPVL
jgi:hypothetical protein